MAVKAKYSTGGEYSPGWNPHVRFTVLHGDARLTNIQREPTPPPALPAPPPPENDEPPAPAPPAWRTVHKRHPREKKPKALPAPAAAPPPPAIEAPPPPNMPAWAQWRREYTL